MQNDNLIQKQNDIIQNLMKQRQKTGIKYFQTQLQQKLANITQRSHKKLSIKTLQNINNQRNQLQRYSNIINSYSPQNKQQSQPSSLNKYSVDSYALDLEGRNSIISNKSQNKKKEDEHYKVKVQDKLNNFNQTQLNNNRGQKLIKEIQIQRNKKPQHNQPKRTKHINPIFESINNRQLLEFLQKNNSSHNQILDLSYFLARCLASFNQNQTITEQQIKHIFLQLQQQITTTDPNKISLNALQLAIKKKYNSFELYILQKIMKSEYIVGLNKLKNKQRHLQKTYNIKLQQLDKKEKDIQAQKKNLTEREKQLSKKQKLYTNKQKQFLQRIKNAKKSLQQKSQQLTTTYLGTLNSAFEKISQKITLYQRNMKYRVQSLNNKANQIHRIRQYKQGEIRNQLIKQLQQKYDKNYSTKYKKLQNTIKQITQKLQKQKKQSQQLEQQNNKIVKILSKLQNKAHKQQSKIKQLLEQINTQKIEIKQLQYLLTQKNQQNQKLLQKVIVKSPSANDLAKNLSNNKITVYKQNIQHHQQIKDNIGGINKSKSKKSLSGRKKKVQHSMRQMKIQLTIQQIISVYDLLLNQLMKTFNKQIRNFTISTNLIKSLLQLIIKLVISQNSNYNSILQLLFEQIIHKFNIFRITQKLKIGNAKQFRSLVSLSIEQLSSQLSFPEQFGYIIKAFYQYISHSLKKQQQTIVISSAWKLISIIFLLSSNQPLTNQNNYQQGYYWLQKLSQLSQLNQIQNQMQQNIKNQQYNFIHAIIIKTICHKQNNIKILTLYCDIILSFKIVNQKKYNKFWQYYIGQIFVSQFCGYLQLALDNQKYYSQHIDQIQRISILIQRLIIGHDIKVKNNKIICFYNLIRLEKCKDRLLYKNLQSIIETYKFRQNLNNNILEEIQNE